MINMNDNTHSLNWIDDLLLSVPNEDADDYTVILRNLVLDNNLKDRENELIGYVNDSNTLHKFSAFYLLLIICREYNNYSKYNMYVDRYGNFFNQYKLYKIVLSTYYRNKAILGEKECYRNCIRFAEEACSVLPTNLAVKHHYAAMIVLAVEDGFEISPDKIENAINGLDSVIATYSNHAVYYSTQGRLLALIGKYEQGEEKLKKALDLEEVNDKDSMIRIGEYNFYLLQIKVMMESQQVKHRINDFNSVFEGIKNDLDSVKTQYLEYLAFFSSVLAYILISIDIAIKTDDFNKCAGIILLFAGSLVIAFSLFRMLLYYSSKVKHQTIKTIFCFVCGIILMIGGLLLGNNFMLSLIN